MQIWQESMRRRLNEVIAQAHELTFRIWTWTTCKVWTKADHAKRGNYILCVKIDHQGWNWNCVLLTHPQTGPVKASNDTHFAWIVICLNLGPKRREWKQRAKSAVVKFTLKSNQVSTCISSATIVKDMRICKYISKNSLAFDVLKATSRKILWKSTKNTKWSPEVRLMQHFVRNVQHMQICIYIYTEQNISN